MGEGGFALFIALLAFLVEVEVVLPAGVASFLVPVADEGAGPELAVEVSSLLDDEVPVHIRVAVMLYLSSIEVSIDASSAHLDHCRIRWPPNLLNHASLSHRR